MRVTRPVRYDMDTLVCHLNPVRWTLLVLSAAAGFAQIAEAQTDLAWRKLGTTAVETGLAGAAGGPVRQVWFSEDGTQLFAHTTRGLSFVTTDFETWTAAPPDAAHWEMPLQRSPAKLPEAQMSLREGGGGRLYAFGRQVYASQDDGRTWIDLTSFNGRSIIGEGPRDVSVSPRDPLSIAVGNDSGIWLSRDGGLSWNGLNDDLPNLPVRALLPGNSVLVDGLGTVAMHGRARWTLDDPSSPDSTMRAALSQKLGARITAVAGAGDFWYAGTADGRIWTSLDARSHWTVSTIQAAGPVERFAVDPDLPRIALMAADSKGAHLFRTLNGGLTWDDITGTLQDVPAHGIAADRVGGAVYVATDKGVFLSRMDLNALGTASPWSNVSGRLPKAVAEDVKLDAAAERLTVALDGYGVYVTRAPHRAGTARVVNAADLTTRAAAPGGLLTTPGLAVRTAVADGRQFPVLAQSVEGSQIQVPFGVEPAEFTLRLNDAVTVGFTVKAVAPAVFVDKDGAPLLLDPETGMMLDGAQPSEARALVQLLATGLGKVVPEWPTGTPAPFANVPVVAADVHAYLNGMPIEVTKATLAPGYVGMYIVEVRIPALLDAGLSDLYLVAGAESSNHVPIRIGY